MFHAPQDEVCPCGCQGTLLAHAELSVHQHPQTPFRRAALQSLLSLFMLVLGVPPSKVQKLSFVLAFHAIDRCSMLQSIQIPLQGLFVFERVNSTFQLRIICKLTSYAFNSCLQIINKNIEQNRP